MIIKKFLAKTEKEAIEMAKEELGPGAIVMNIKKVQPKGLSRLFVKGKVEVTAALDENIVYDAESGDREAKDPERAGARLDLTAPKFVPDIVADEHAEVQNEDAKNVAVIEEKLNSLQKMIEKQISEKVDEEKKHAAEEKDEKAPVSYTHLRAHETS